MILPGFGIISEVLPVFARKPIFGYKAIAASTVVIAFLRLLVWAHHMFATPAPTVVLGFFMLSSFLIAVPTGVKIFNWIATLWRGTHRVQDAAATSPSASSRSSSSAASPASSSPSSPSTGSCTDTYFVVAHFHYVLIGGAVFSDLRRPLLLVPEDDRPDAERAARQGLLLARCSSAST